MLKSLKILVVTALFGSLGTIAANAAGEAFCNNYAAKSVEQYHRAQQLGKNVSGLRWNGAFDAHKLFCLVASEAAAQHELSMREAQLGEQAPASDQGGAAPSTAPTATDSASITRFDQLSGAQNPDRTYKYTFAIAYRASIISQDSMLVGIYIEEFERANCAGAHRTIGNQSIRHGRGLATQTINVTVNRTLRRRGSFAPGIAFFYAHSSQIYRQFGTDNTFCVNYGIWP